MKKLAALFLTLVMILGCIPAMADGDANTNTTPTTYTITINNAATGHIYEAYQIFTGDLFGASDSDVSAGTNAKLSNIEWGNGVTVDATYDAADIAARLSNDYSGDDKLKLDDLLKIITLSTPCANSNGTSNPYVISGLTAGYYLVKDKDGSLNGKEDYYTEFIIEVVENSTASPKGSVPVVEKKVQDTSDTEGATTNWQDSADYDIGDAVPFQLKATLASNVSAYDTYKVVFTDMLSAGLTYAPVNDEYVFKAYLGEDNNRKDVTASFTCDAGDNNTFTFTCNNVKDFGAADNSVITIEYKATLNESAVIGAAGNPNKVKLTFSNNPNGDGEGTTLEDKVTVFTYKLIVNKVDENNKPLTGAKFTLYKNKNQKNDDGTIVWTEISTQDGAAVKDANDTTTAIQFTWSGLDDGEYKLEETVTPAGYNSIEPIVFTITAEHEVESADPALTNLAVTAESFTVETDTITVGETTKNVPTGSVTTTIENKAGSTLPETGGMGTTLLYVGGGVLVLAALVILIAKRRVNAD